MNNSKQQSNTTGAQIDGIDYRAISYERVVGTENISASALPLAYETDISMLPVLNQGQQPACVGHAESFIVQFLAYLETKGIVKLSPRFLYSLAKKIQGNYDWGTQPSLVAKILKDTGCSTDALVPNDTSLSQREYIDGVVVTDAIKNDARNQLIGGFVWVAPSAEMLKDAIVRAKLVSFTIPFTGNQYQQPIGKPQSISDFHRMVFYGYRTDSNGDTVFKYRNSHGEQYGKGGNGELRFLDYKGLIFDCLTYIDIPQSIIDEVKALDAQFSYTFTKDLTIGARGTEVTALQRALLISGHFYDETFGDTRPTEYFGNVTKRSLTRYQSDSNISPTGFCGRLTRASLNARYAKKKVVSDAGVSLIKSFESLHDGNKATPQLEPQRDPAGYWTLGWGARYDINMREVTASTPAITPAIAYVLLKRDIARFEDIVNKNITRPLTQNQYDALVSFCYNLGGLLDLKQKVNDNTVTRKDFTAYVYAGGVYYRGLFIRRNKEADLYFNTTVSNNNNMKSSSSFSFNSADFKSFGRGVLLAMAGAGIAYVQQYITGADFGQYTVFVSAFNSIVLNGLRLWVQNNQAK